MPLCEPALASGCAAGLWDRLLGMAVAYAVSAAPLDLGCPPCDWARPLWLPA